MRSPDPPAMNRARFTPQQEADTSIAMHVQQSFPRHDQKYCLTDHFGKSPSPQSIPQSPSGSGHRPKSTGCFTPASSTIQRPLLANTILPGSLSSTRKNNRANPMLAGQVHPTASSRCLDRQSCPAIFSAPQSKVLRSRTILGKAPPAIHLTNSSTPGDSIKSLYRLLNCCRLTPSCPEAFRGTAKKQNAQTSCWRPGSPHSKKWIPRPSKLQHNPAFCLIPKY
jgi:hypothetical protein